MAMSGDLKAKVVPIAMGITGVVLLWCAYKKLM